MKLPSDRGFEKGVGVVTTAWSGVSAAKTHKYAKQQGDPHPMARSIGASFVGSKYEKNAINKDAMRRSTHTGIDYK